MSEVCTFLQAGLRELEDIRIVQFFQAQVRSKSIGFLEIRPRPGAETDFDIRAECQLLEESRQSVWVTTELIKAVDEESEP